MLMAGPSGTVLSLPPPLAVSSSSSPHAAPNRTKAASTAITFRCRLIGLFLSPGRVAVDGNARELSGHRLGLDRHGCIGGPAARRPPPHQPALGQREEPVG